MNKTNKASAYIFKNTLGKGTFGEVKLGIHKQTKMKVAIKILEKKKIKTSEDKNRIEREFKILKTLNHPNICKMYEIIEEEDRILVIMEHAEKGDLFNYIVSNKKMKEKETHRFFLQLISALKYMHSFNIMHRDIKPENILLFGSGDKKIVKFIDFGLSDLYNKGYNIKTACGSPSYAAPEILSGQPYNGLKADIWSLGIVLYAMVCGYLPFEENEEQKLFEKIVNSYFHIPSFVSTAITDLLKHILEKNPKKRLNFEEILQHPWCLKYDNEFLQQEEIDSFSIFNIMKREYFFDFEYKEFIHCLEKNQYGKYTTLYYLLKKKIEENQLDIGKLNFESYGGSSNIIRNSVESRFKTDRSCKKRMKINKDRKKNLKFQSYQENVLRSDSNNEKYKQSRKNSKNKPNTDNTLFRKLFQKIKFDKIEKKNYFLKDNDLNIYYQKDLNKKKNENITSSVNKPQLKIFKVKKQFGTTFHSISKKQKSNSISKNKNKNNIFLSFTQNVQNLEEKIKKKTNIKTYKGPINIKAIFNKKPILIIKELKKIFKNLHFEIKSSNSTSVEIIKNNSCFKFFLMALEHLQGCYILRYSSRNVDPNNRDFGFYEKILNLVNDTL